MPRKKVKTGRNFKLVAICAALVFATLSFMTVGFARYNRVLDVAGNVDLKPQGKIYASSVTFVDGKNVSSNPTFTDRSIDFGLKIFATASESEYYANYDVTIKNETFYDQTFSTEYWQTQFTNSKGEPVDGITAEYELIGIKNGDVINHDGEITFKVRISFTVTEAGNFDVIGGIDINFSETNTGFLLAYVKEPLVGDLRSPNQQAAFTVHVSNSFPYSKTFSLLLSGNSKFTISPASGQSLDNITIAANSEADYVVYVSINGEQDFSSTYERTTILMRSGSTDMNAGRISLYVDQSIIYTDHEPPQISNVKLTALNAESEAQATWDATDDVTIKDFTVQIVDASGNIVQTKTTTDDTTTISFQGLEPGEYYARVYGEDSLGNTATADQNAAYSTTADTCSRSDTVNLLWRYAITEHLTQVTKSSGESTVVRVESVAIIHEMVEYYHVVSARFYNVIANGFVATDGTVALSNLYGFDAGLRWPATREAYLAQPGSTYSYNEFADLVPKHMYVGMRMGEIKAITDAGYLSLDEFKTYLSANQVSSFMWLHPESKVVADDLQNFDTKRLLAPSSVGRQHVWPVSFGDFKTSTIEGREVILPTQPDVEFWRNFIDGKLYHPGDRVKIMCGTHFAPVK